LPAYQDYIVRSKVSEPILLADGCKTSVAEYYQSNGKLPPTLSSSGCDTTKTTYAKSLNVVTGKIEVTLSTNTGLSTAAGSLFVLSPSTQGLDNPLVWRCDSATGTSIPAKYLPAKCRTAG